MDLTGMVWLSGFFTGVVTVAAAVSIIRLVQSIRKPVVARLAEAHNPGRGSSRPRPTSGKDKAAK